MDKRIAVDRTTAERRRFELRAYLEEVLVSLQPVTRKARLTVELDCPPGLVIDSYPGAFSQVVVNFVQNSVIHAYAEGAEGRLTLAAHAGADGAIELAYADDGRGIPAEILPNIFDPFFTTRRGQGGTGLGLHIVYNLVTATLGGKIAVTSEVGRGTRFTLTLPAAAPEGAG